MTLFPNKVTSEVLGVRTSAYPFLRGHNSNQNSLPDKYENDREDGFRSSWSIKVWKDDLTELRKA